MNKLKKKKRIIFNKCLTLEVYEYFTTEGKLAHRELIREHQNHVISESVGVNYSTHQDRFREAVKTLYGTQH